MVGNSGELVDSELLGGNVHSSRGAIEFLERVLRALPEGLEAGPRYHYFALVTNIDRHSPKRLWQSYGRRASIEALFKEAKLGFGLDRLPSAKHVANQAYIKLVFLAYNLVHWFRRHLLAGAWAKARIKTLRDWLLRIPAKVVHTATGWVIDLPRGHPSLGALQQIQLTLTSA